MKKIMVALTIILLSVTLTACHCCQKNDDPKYVRYLWNQTS